MHDVEHIEILRAGPNEWNSWREHSHELPQLRGVLLEQLDLREYDLTGTDFADAHLEEVRLSHCNLSSSIWSRAAVIACDLVRADLFMAVGIAAQFKQCVLSREFCLQQFHKSYV